MSGGRFHYILCPTCRKKAGPGGFPSISSDLPQQLNDQRSIALISSSSSLKSNSSQHECHIDHEGVQNSIEQYMYSHGLSDLAIQVKRDILTMQKATDGSDGQPGKDGSNGLPGEKGEKGDSGENGSNGLPGEKGEKGDSGEKGEAGKDGTAAGKGEKGDPGQNGLPGEKGDPGQNGSPGEKGEKGEKGDPGEKGNQGSPGTNGVDGQDGKPGEKGDPGPIISLLMYNQSYTTLNGSFGAESAANDWLVVSSFISRGKKDPAWTQALAMMYTIVAGISYRVSLFDVTNNVVLAASLPSSNGTPSKPEIVDLGLIQNISPNPACIEVQILVTDATGETGTTAEGLIGIKSMQIWT